MAKTKAGNQGADSRPLEDLMQEILAAFFDLRAAGQTLGVVTEWGAGNWGLLRMLKTEGPRTVPEVAQVRAVSRQYIQRLANELLAEGLIEMVENPTHRRSRLMTLTPSGRRKLEGMSKQIRQFLRDMADDFDGDEVRRSTRTIAAFRRHINEALGSQTPPR